MPKDESKKDAVPNVTGPVKPLNAAAREALQENWEKSQGISPEASSDDDKKPSAGDEKGDSPTPSDKKPGDTAGPSDKGPAGVDTEKVEGAKDAKKDDKTVPHQALHEERELHKETKAQLKEAQEQVRMLLADLKKIHDEKANGKSDDEPEELPEMDELEPAVAKIIVDLRKEVAELKKDSGKRQESEREAALRAEVAKAEKMVADTNSSLEAEGFKGFSKFKHLVREELVRIGESNPEEAKKLDNPQGWAKLYREKVYPEISGLFVAKAKADKLKEKDDNKVGADLVDSKGGGAGDDSKKDKKDDEWSYGDYLTMRERLKIV